MTADAMTYLLLLGIVGSGLSTMAYVWLVLERGPLFAGMSTYVVPVIAMLWGTLDHETISPLQTGAIAGVLGMVALVQSGSKANDENMVSADAKPHVDGLRLVEAAGGERLVSLPVTEISLRDRRAQQRNRKSPEAGLSPVGAAAVFCQPRNFGLGESYAPLVGRSDGEF